MGVSGFVEAAENDGRLLTSSWSSALEEDFALSPEWACCWVRLIPEAPNTSSYINNGAENGVR